MIVRSRVIYGLCLISTRVVWSCKYVGLSKSGHVKCVRICYYTTTEDI